MASPVHAQSPKSMTPPVVNLYSHIAVVDPGSEYVYFAGQVGTDRDGKAPEDLLSQTNLVLDNIKSGLTARGGTARNIASVTVYVVDYDAASCPIWEPYRQFMTDSMGTHCPPCTLVPLPKLAAPEFKVEVQVVAAFPPSISTLPSRISAPQATIPNVDVVVIGAGLSGLTAATEIHDAGFSVAVLEGKDRVGGKTWSIPMNHSGGVVDVGAAWINNVTQPKIYALYQKFGCTPIVQKMKGRELFREFRSKRFEVQSLLYPSLPEMGQKELDTYHQIFLDMDRDAKQIDLYDSTRNSHIEDISLGDFFRSKGAQTEGVVFKIWTMWIRVLTGAEPDDIGLVYWLDYIKSGGGVRSLLSDDSDGAQYMTNSRGNQTISKCLAASLGDTRVHLRDAVRCVTQISSQVCQVETLSGAIYRCKHILISIPTPLYRHITFTPPLPREKLEIVNATHLGTYSKCVLVYAKPWWRDAGLNGSFCDLEGPVSFSRDVSSDTDGMFAIACFIVGEYAVKWSRLAPSRRVKAVKDQIASLMGDNNTDLKAKVYDTIQTIEQEWMKEAWSEGAPCPMLPPGGTWAALGNELRRPYGSLHFIGTETAYEWKGYMEGAVRAGERGAVEVIKSLRSSQPKI